MMNPVGQRTVNQIANWYRLKLAIDYEVFPDCSFLFFLLLFIELVETNWRDVRSSADARYLCS